MGSVYSLLHEERVVGTSCRAESGLLSAEALEALAGIECINKLQADAAELILPRLGTSFLTDAAVVSGMPQAAGRTPSTQVYLF